MTEQDFIDTLPAEMQAAIAAVRETLGDDRRVNAFILLDGQIVETDLFVASIWLSIHRDTATIAKTRIGLYEFSTVFITVPLPDGEHFETMLFGRNGSRCMGRYETLWQAEAGHEDLVRRADVILSEFTGEGN